MKLKPIDMTPIWKKYKGLWVAMEENRNKRVVVGSGKTLIEAMSEAKKKGYKMPIMSHIPYRILPMIGGML